jgi:hypothetical protein
VQSLPQCTEFLSIFITRTAPAALLIALWGMSDVKENKQVSSPFRNIKILVSATDKSDSNCMHELLQNSVHFTAILHSSCDDCDTQNFPL